MFRLPKHGCWPYGLMSLLSSFGPSLVGRRLARHIPGPESVSDIGARFAPSLIRHIDRVGSHIRDEAHGLPVAPVDALVQLLCQAHRPLGGEPEATRGLLLESAGDERRCRLSSHLFLVHLRDLVDRIPQILDQGLRRLLSPNGHFLPFHPNQLRSEAAPLFHSFGQLRLDRPVLLRDERLDLPFPLHDQAKSHRLHPSRRQAAPHVAPQEGADLIPHQSIQDAPRLLRVHQPHIDRARVSES